LNFAKASNNVILISFKEFASSKNEELIWFSHENSG
jgi:hypothetical protein